MFQQVHHQCLHQKSCHQLIMILLQLLQKLKSLPQMLAMVSLIQLLLKWSLPMMLATMSLIQMLLVQLLQLHQLIYLQVSRTHPLACQGFLWSSLNVESECDVEILERVYVHRIIIQSSEQK